jgi:hypothetical protein
MKSIKNKARAMVAAGLFGVAASNVNAAVVFSYTQVGTGSTPSSTSPWLTATFEDGTGADAGSVFLTIQSSLEAAGEFISDVYFNFDPLQSVSVLSAVVDSTAGTLGSDPTFDTVTPPPFQVAGNSFDFAVHFDTAPPGDRFDGTTDAVVFKISSTGTLSEDDFAYAADVSGGQFAFFSLAHVQGIPGGLSGWVSPEDPFGPSEVPLPAAAWLFMAGLVPLAGFLRKRRAALEV